jgi:hypothetical protein
MNVISGYRELFKDQNYDRVNNPKRLSVKELRPIGVEWFVENKQFRIDLKDSARLRLLSDMSGIAVVQFDSDEKKGGKAYIINPDGTKKFDIKLPTEYSASRFYDVYYIDDDLYFFFYDGEDYRALVDVSTGEVKSIHISR